MWNLIGLAGLTPTSGRPDQGARLMGAVAALVPALRADAFADTAAEYDATVAAARAALGEGPFVAADDGAGNLRVWGVDATAAPVEPACLGTCQ